MSQRLTKLTMFARPILLWMALTCPIAAQEAEPDDADAGGRYYWSLKGGGEIVGIPVDEKLGSIFIDIGPDIITVPLDSVVTSGSLDDLSSSEKAEVIGTGSGIFDPETGSLIFRGPRENGDLLSQTEVVERAKESIVLISNPRAAGSGFLLDREGRIVTNQHVTANEKYQTVNIFRRRGNQWEREKIENVPVESYSTLYDIAILKMDMDQVEEKGLEIHPLPIAEPGSLEVGDLVYAIGNPGVGARLLEHSVSEGIVSSLARNINDVIYIQTTAAVNPGNSGGPLVNQDGEVVGLVTLKASFQEGIAFALPVALVLHFLRNSESYAFSEQSQNQGYRYLTPE